MSIPFSFGFSAFIRLYLPGLFFSILTFPLFSDLSGNIKMFPNLSNPSFIPISAIFWAVIVYILDDKIYKIFVGDMLWPGFLKKFKVKRENRYVEKLSKQKKKLEDEGKKKSGQYTDVWCKLNIFPINSNIKDDKEYDVHRPTRLGNIIYGYESYPSTRYGMDAAFFWYRIWLRLEKNIKDEIDPVKSKADCAVFSSFVFYVSFVIHLIAFVVSYFQARNVIFLVSSKTFLIIALVSLILGYLSYLCSLSLHEIYGEFFKSIFDLHKDVIYEMGKPFSKEEKDKIRNMVWYLHFRNIYCSKCSEFHSKYKCKKGHKLTEDFEIIEKKDKNHGNKEVAEEKKGSKDSG
jgi:hypothetical protein